MNNNNPKVSGLSLFAIGFEAVMSLIYLGVAYILLATERLNHVIDERFRLPLGIILIVYGLFRIYRSIKKLKSVKDEIK